MSIRPDQRIRLQCDHWRHVSEIGFQLGVVREDVADHIELLAALVRVVDTDAECDFIAKAVVAGAQAVARLAGINRVGAEGEGSLQHGLRACRGEEFR
jgi:hypothetical protein